MKTCRACRATLREFRAGCLARTRLCGTETLGISAENMHVAFAVENIEAAEQLG